MVSNSSIVNYLSKEELDKYIPSLLEKGKTITLSGGPGSGKSTYIKELGSSLSIKYLGPTNLASVVLPYGETIYSGLNIPIPFQSNSHHKVVKALINLALHNYRALIIDEAFMLPGSILEAILKAKEECNSLLSKNKRGPIGLLLVGDPSQLLAIGTERASNNDPFFNSSITNCQHRFGLSSIYRQSNSSREWVEIINGIRKGSITNLDVKDIPSSTPTQDYKYTIVSSNKEVEDTNSYELLLGEGDLLEDNGFIYKIGSPVVLKEPYINPNRVKVLAKGTPGVIKRKDSVGIYVEVDGRYVYNNDALHIVKRPSLVIPSTLLQLAYAGNIYTVQGMTKPNIHLSSHPSMGNTHGASLVAITRHTHSFTSDSTSVSFFQHPSTFNFV
jgi:hypothetical protein